MPLGACSHRVVSLAWPGYGCLALEFLTLDAHSKRIIDVLATER